MSRSDPSKRSAARRLKALPWAVLAQGAYVVGKRWRTLSEKERGRLASLLRSSGGRPRNLSEKDRRELRRLAGKLELGTLARELLGVARGRGGRKGRRRS